MKVIAVTACPSGVAHTYLAAESLELAAKKLGIEIWVETQGSIGIENEIPENIIEEADAVILTNDIGIKYEERFKGKAVIRLSAGDCIKKSELILTKLQAKLQERMG